ncbi:hypothetical protein COMNV_00745 [Commensalibacter sp. Nvir]|uniref:FUSC family protein n=1 Tax=Commensalibacter sp. Nvir TaxID=3069817 RepID=UPI002D5D7AE0|nr:hypothetical protein COMNV_00745 [Commensalibacter sp. Nvir]
MQINRRELISSLQQSMRLLLSIALASFIAHLCHLHEPYWALMTSIIATQSKIAQTLQTSRDQIVGAIIGGSAGLIAIALQQYFGWSPLLAFSIVIIPMAALVSWRPSMRLGMVTLAVVILFPAPGEVFERPFDRIFSIIVGVIASLIASYCVLKSQARNNVFLSAASALDKINILLHYALTSPIVWEEVETMNDSITNELRKLSDELAEVRKEHPTLVLEHYDPVLIHIFSLLRRLQSDSIFVERALDEKKNRLTKHYQLEITTFLQKKIKKLTSLCNEQANYSKPYVPIDAKDYAFGCDVSPILSKLKGNCPSIVYFTLEALLKDLVEGQRLLFQK